MRNLDTEFDRSLMSLESEWRQAYEASRTADLEFTALSSKAKVKSVDIRRARARLDEAEQLKAVIMSKIERLEETLMLATGNEG